jgi:glycerol-3-phosphate acyltransferase PlsY
MIIFYKIIFIIAAYLFGSIPVGYILYKVKTGGHRQQGGNVGTNYKKLAQLLEFNILIDILKVPALWQLFIFPVTYTCNITAVLAVLGHDFDILNFKVERHFNFFGAIIVCAVSFAENCINKILPMVKSWLSG